MPKKEEDEIYLHDVDIKFQVESIYQERPTEKEFLTGMLKLLKHLTANPGQIYSPGIKAFKTDTISMKYEDDEDSQDLIDQIKKDSMIWPADPDDDDYTLR